MAATTTTGQQYLYDGTIPFESYRETTEHIGALSTKLEDGQGSSQRIRTLYRRRSRRRTHATNALIRDLVSRLQNDDVDTLYIGDLSGGFDTSWSVIANEKVHNFWAYRQFQNRLEDICEEQGITLDVRSEAWTSRECPDCGERDTTIRHKDSLTCECGFDGHADLTASRSLLTKNVGEQTVSRPTARPVRFQWDNHEWRSTTDAPEKAQRNAYKPESCHHGTASR